MAFGDADLGVFFADFGVPVVFGGKTVLGNFDRPVAVKLADMGYGGIETAAPSVRLPYNAFSPMPVSRDAITVDGVAYTVSNPTAEADGSIVSYDLKAASL